jgi:hypothetical protein
VIFCRRKEEEKEGERRREEKGGERRGEESEISTAEISGKGDRESIIGICHSIYSSIYE